MAFRHQIVGEQYINNKYFDEIIMKDVMHFPAVMLQTDKTLKLSLFKVFKNCFDLKVGDTYIYIELNGTVTGLGKVTLNIDNIFRIETLFSSLGLTLLYKESKDSEIRQITSEDFIDTLELSIRVEGEA